MERSATPLPDGRTLVRFALALAVLTGLWGLLTGIMFGFSADGVEVPMSWAMGAVALSVGWGAVILLAAVRSLLTVALRVIRARDRNHV